MPAHPVNVVLEVHRERVCRAQDPARNASDVLEDRQLRTTVFPGGAFIREDRICEGRAELEQDRMMRPEDTFSHPGAHLFTQKRKVLGEQVRLSLLRTLAERVREAFQGDKRHFVISETLYFRIVYETVNFQRLVVASE